MHWQVYYFKTWRPISEKQVCLSFAVSIDKESRGKCGRWPVIYFQCVSPLRKKVSWPTMHSTEMCLPHLSQLLWNDIGTRGAVVVGWTDLLKGRTASGNRTSDLSVTGPMLLTSRLMETCLYGCCLNCVQYRFQATYRFSINICNIWCWKELEYNVSSSY
jgi:hypothetical protein